MDWPQGMLGFGVSNSDLSFDSKTRKMIKQSERCTHISVSDSRHTPPHITDNSSNLCYFIQVTGQLNTCTVCVESCTVLVPSHWEQPFPSGANSPPPKPIARATEVKTCITHQISFALSLASALSIYPQVGVHVIGAYPSVGIPDRR